MQVPHKMDQKLESLIRRPVIRLSPCPVFQQTRHVLDGIQHVSPSTARPPALAGEQTRLGRVVVQGTDVVQCGGPAHLEAEFIGPGGYWGEMAWLLRLGCCVVREDVADGGENGGVEVHLGDGGYYFVT